MLSNGVAKFAFNMKPGTRSNDKRSALAQLGPASYRVELESIIDYYLY